MALRFPPSPATRRRMRGNNLHAPLNEVDYRLVSVFSPDTSFSSGGGLPPQPTPSPDEMVIAARGRRSLPLTFSPDVHTTPLRHRQPINQQGSNLGAQQGSGTNGGPLVANRARSTRLGWQTPPNSVSRLLLPTRTSPRKRLTLTDSPPTSNTPSTSSPNSTSSPSVGAGGAGDSKSKRASPISKRYRANTAAAATAQQLFLQEQQLTDSLNNATSNAGSSPDTTGTSSVLSSSTIQPDPATLLKGLSRDQMVTLLTGLMEKRPEVKEDIRNLMPEPDLAAMEDHLNYLKRNIFKSLPNSRLESKSDSMAYNRVSTHLAAFKKAVVDQGKRLVEAQSWVSVLDHAVMAWTYVRSTPVWDNAPHNNARRQCFKALAANALQAIKKGVWTAETAADVRDRMSSMEKDSEDVGLCIKQLDLIINNGNETATAASSPEKKE